jgi:hypothetical protein
VAEELQQRSRVIKIFVIFAPLIIVGGRVGKERGGVKHPESWKYNDEYT